MASSEEQGVTPERVSRRDSTLPPCINCADNITSSHTETPKTAQKIPFGDEWVLNHVQKGSYKAGLTQLRVWALKTRRVLNTQFIDKLRGMPQDIALQAIKELQESTGIIRQQRSKGFYTPITLLSLDGRIKDTTTAQTDSGSTHSLIDCQLAKRLGLHAVVLRLLVLRSCPLREIHINKKTLKDSSFHITQY